MSQSEIITEYSLSPVWMLIWERVKQLLVLLCFMYLNKKEQFQNNNPFFHCFYLIVIKQIKYFLVITVICVA